MVISLSAEDGRPDEQGDDEGGEHSGFYEGGEHGCLPW